MSVSKRVPKPIKSTSKKVLEPEYIKLFNSMIFSESFLDEAKTIALRILENKNLYEKVDVNVPWYVIGILHYKEQNFDFSVHLHNGNSLSNRTKSKPKNRPKTGKPPFSWFESAADAIKLKSRYSSKKSKEKWSLVDCLYFLEGYHGFEERLQKNRHSSYLWSGSNIRDHKSDNITLDKDYRAIGAAIILKLLQNSLSL